MDNKNYKEEEIRAKNPAPTGEAGDLDASASSESGGKAALEAGEKALSGNEGDQAPLAQPAAQNEEDDLPDMTPAAPDHAEVEAIMAKIVADTVGDIPEVPVKPKKKKMNSFLKASLILLAALAFSCVMLYFYYAMSYRDKYLKGTCINGMDVSDMKPEDVEAIIRERVESYTLTLTFRDGEKTTLTKEDMGFQFVNDGGARKILENQNIFAWFIGYFDRYWPYTIGEGYKFEQEKLEQTLKNLKELSEENQQAPTDAYLKREGDYIVIEPETQGNSIVFEKLLEVVSDSVTHIVPSVDVSDSEGMYREPKVLSDDTALTLQMRDLNGFCDNVTTLHLPGGATRVLDRTTLIDWLSVDQTGYYYINVDELKKRCSEYVAALAAEVDVTYNTRVFHSTNFGDIYFNSAPWGYTIDQEAEAERLFNDLCAKVSSDREPAYSLYKEYDDTFGGTYVEVDITYQRVYYYENGERVLAADCVTGTDNEERHTVTGIYSIYYKERERTLRGQPDENGEPSYTSFVNYWMAFYGGYGLHDASWRSSFGGSIYKYSGSHGCVNLSYSVARELYNYVTVGTPVIVFKM